MTVNLNEIVEIFEERDKNVIHVSGMGSEKAQYIDVEGRVSRRITRQLAKRGYFISAMVTHEDMYNSPDSDNGSRIWFNEIEIQEAKFLE